MLRALLQAAQQLQGGVIEVLAGEDSGGGADGQAATDQLDLDVALLAAGAGPGGEVVISHRSSLGSAVLDDVRGVDPHEGSARSCSVNHASRTLAGAASSQASVTSSRSSAVSTRSRSTSR